MLYTYVQISDRSGSKLEFRIEFRIEFSRTEKNPAQEMGYTKVATNVMQKIE